MLDLADRELEEAAAHLAEGPRIAGGEEAGAAVAVGLVLDALAASVSATSRAGSSAEKTSVTSRPTRAGRRDGSGVVRPPRMTVSTSAAPGARHSRTGSSIAAPYGSSLWIRGTSPGHATGVKLDAGVESRERLRIADRVDRGAVARKPIRRARVACTAARASGVITPMTGTGVGLQAGQRGSGRGVARHDDELDVLGLEAGRDLVCESAQLLERVRAVRETTGIAEVHEVLVREGDEALVEDGEPSDTRVEQAYGAGVHGSKCKRGYPSAAVGRRIVLFLALFVALALVPARLWPPRRRS